MKWFIAWAKYHSITYQSEPEIINPDEEIVKPEMIRNKDLLVFDENLTYEHCHIKNEVEYYDEEKESHTGRILEDNLRENTDFVALSENLFKYLWNQYGCDFKILRYAIRNIAKTGKTNAKWFIDFYLSKLKIMDVPKDKGQNAFEYILISMNDTVEDLYKRIGLSRSTDNFRMWKATKPDSSQSFKDYYQSFRNQFNESKRVKIVYVDGEIIDYNPASKERASSRDRLNWNKRTIGSLLFTNDHILLIEHAIEGQSGFIFEVKPEVEIDADTLTIDIDTKAEKSNYNYISYDVKSSVMPYFQEGGKVGISNIGNTWYLNSVLQCLSHTPDLRAYFLSYQYENDINYNNEFGSKGRLWEEFKNMLIKLWEENRRMNAPHRLKDVLGDLDEIYEGGMQNDAYELLILMLDTFHEDLNKITEK